jgi:hypothetical protein
VADLLEKSSAWLEDQREKFMSRTVIYQRPGSPAPDTVEVTATIGQTVFAVDNGEGAALQVESRDYLIRAAHLVLGGGPVLPRRGDQIHELQDGVIFIYEVMAPGDEPVWRYSDPYRKTLRIHTKQVDKEVTP